MVLGREREHIPTRGDFDLILLLFGQLDRQFAACHGVASGLFNWKMRLPNARRCGTYRRQVATQVCKTECAKGLEIMLSSVRARLVAARVIARENLDA